MIISLLKGQKILANTMTNSRKLWKDENNGVIGDIGAVIENFINLSTLDATSKLLYPVIDFNKNVFAGAFTHRTEKKLSGKKFASILSQLNKHYFKSSCVGEKVSFSLPICHSWAENLDDGNAKKVILKIKDCFDRTLSDYGRLILHGSYATCDYVHGWSDLDFIVILNRGVIMDETKLLYVRKQLNGIRTMFYEIDPLQHHGFFILSEEQLNNYSENKFPIETLKNSIVLCGSPKIRLNVVEKSRERALRQIAEFCGELQKMPKNIYEWKLHISKALLLPSLFLEFKGVFVYKRDSFTKLRRFLKGDENHILNQIENLRTNWKTPTFTNHITQILAKLNINPFICLIPSLISSWSGDDDSAFRQITTFAHIILMKTL